MTTEITQEVRDRLTEIISHGLVAGLGRPVRGELCIEAAVCLALGEPHSAVPSCVHKVDRGFALHLNDTQWSSPATRAEALLPIALAQLGTAGADRIAWIRYVVLETVRRLLPIALEAEGAAAHLVEACREAADLRTARHAAFRAVESDGAVVAARATTAAVNAATLAQATVAATNAAAFAALVAAHAAGVLHSDDPLRLSARIAMEAYRLEGRA